MLDILITIASIVILACIWVMLYDTNRFVITRYEIKDKRIRKSVRAVMLADLHNKRFGKENERLLAAIEECNPDVILVAGDILTAKPGESLDVAVKLMRALAAKYPIYYGNGNHEQRLKLYPEEYGDMAERYDRALEEMGIRPLVNCHVELQECGIIIYGAEIARSYYKRFKVQRMEETYLKELLGQADADNYTVLLAHNPDYFPQYAAWGADLVCSGHVHGGMVRVPFWNKGVVSPKVQLFPKYDGGVFREGKSTMLLSRGLGVHTIPIRLFNPGELYLIEFAPEE